VARLGAELFGRHLIALEVAGALLLVALIGAAAIVSHVSEPPASGPPNADEEPAARSGPGDT
jgi:hypothetical protein